MSRLKKFWALSAADKKTFLGALAGLPMLSLKLRLFGLKRTVSKLQQTPLAEQSIDIELPAHAEQLSYLVNAAARVVFRREACLEHSLMLWSLLRRRGIESEMKIGVATEGSAMRAHAWVEIGGRPINEQPMVGKQFAAFDASFTADYKDFS